MIYQHVHRRFKTILLTCAAGRLLSLVFAYIFWMEELVIATNNAGKLKELAALLKGIKVLSLKDIGFDKEIPEPFNTFKENAHAKALTIYQFCGKNTLADDSGLIVEALNGAPGVHSAYYGGEPRSDARNNARLLQDMEGVKNRAAHYTAVLCLLREGSEHYFDGVCRGNIAMQEKGTGGFGYDPLFIPNGYDQTFGELPAEEKKKISHRANAMQMLQEFWAS
jgi:XTP/dITP diphosphohydrolase